MRTEKEIRRQIRFWKRYPETDPELKKLHGDYISALEWVLEESQSSDQKEAG